MSNGVHDLVLFLGRFHPMLVHLPIGGLVLLAVLELLAKAATTRNCYPGTNRRALPSPRPAP